MQLNQKMLQVGKGHPDRDKQFQFINDKAKKFLKAGVPVISIDAKKKENIGNFINKGRTYRKKKEPTKVVDHDFPIKELGKVTPYGVYDTGRNEGFVNLGISSDTSEFAAESISRWRLTLGKKTYPKAKNSISIATAAAATGAETSFSNSNCSNWRIRAALKSMYHISRWEQVNGIK